MPLYGMERPYNDGNTMIQDQFMKPFKPVFRYWIVSG
jgi:hypothetical protein